MIRINSCYPFFLKEKKKEIAYLQAYTVFSLVVHKLFGCVLSLINHVYLPLDGRKYCLDYCISSIWTPRNFRRIVYRYFQQLHRQHRSHSEALTHAEDSIKLVNLLVLIALKCPTYLMLLCSQKLRHLVIRILLLDHFFWRLCDSSYHRQCSMSLSLLRKLFHMLLIPFDSKWTYLLINQESRLFEIALKAVMMLFQPELQVFSAISEFTPGEWLICYCWQLCLNKSTVY